MSENPEMQSADLISTDLTSYYDTLWNTKLKVYSRDGYEEHESKR
jgi:hypothetical protein